jgi:hypothetical protein
VGPPSKSRRASETRWVLPGVGPFCFGAATQNVPVKDHASARCAARRFGLTMALSGGEAELALLILPGRSGCPRPTSRISTSVPWT